MVHKTLNTRCCSAAQDEVVLRWEKLEVVWGSLLFCVYFIKKKKHIFYLLTDTWCPSTIASNSMGFIESQIFEVIYVPT